MPEKCGNTIKPYEWGASEISRSMSVSFSSYSSFMLFLCCKIKLPFLYWAAALPGAPQPPSVTSLQPLSAPLCVLIWTVVVIPKMPFLGQLHLVPPTPLPSLNKNWHSVLSARCLKLTEAWQRCWSPHCCLHRYLCNTRQHGWRGLANTHTPSPLSQSHSPTIEGLCPQFSPPVTLHLLCCTFKEISVATGLLVLGQCLCTLPIFHPMRTPREIPRPKQDSARPPISAPLERLRYIHIKLWQGYQLQDFLLSFCVWVRAPNLPATKLKLVCCMLLESNYDWFLQLLHIRGG